MIPRPLTIVFLATLAATVAAEETPPDNAARIEAAKQELEKLKTVRRDRAARAYEVVKKVETASEKARAAASAAATDEARREAAKQARELRDTLEEARSLFAKAFVQCDWREWDAADAPEIVEMGLRQVISQAADEGNGEMSVAACEKLLADFPESKHAARTRSRSLPVAYVLALPPAAAREKIEALARTEGLEDGDRRSLLMQIGDLHGLEGNFEGAAAAYEAAVEGIPEELEPRDPLARLVKDVEMRSALVGKPAPEIETLYWLGGEKATLASLAGRVAILDFWATWCPPCRAVMPHLDGIARDHPEDDLAVLGVTRRYARGWLPAAGGAEGGESVRGLEADEDFDAHLVEFRERFGSTYPYVVGAKDAFTGYHIRGIPSLFLLDRKGVVRYVKVGSGNEPVLDKVLGLLLAE